MPRYTIQTTGAELVYFATDEDAEAIETFRSLLLSRYPQEGEALFYDALSRASREFAEKAKGKAILAYLRSHYAHLEPATVSSDAEELVDISAELDALANSVGHRMSEIRKELQAEGFD